MGKLLKFNLISLFKQKSFYICMALTFLITTFLPIVMTFISKGTKEEVFPQIISVLTAEPGVVAVILITLIATFEFSEGTAKNIIARGYTRKQLFLSKYLISVLAVFVIDIIISLIIFVFFIKNGLGFESSMIYQLIGYVFSIFAKVAFFVSIAFIIEKTGGAIIANIFIPMFIPTILSFVGLRLNMNLSTYWIDGISSTLNEKNIDMTNVFHSGLLALIYTTVFLLLAIFITRKREVK